MARRILIVTNRPPWQLTDGGAMAMHQLIAGYAQEGWEVHLLAMNTARHGVEESELQRVYADLPIVTIAPFDNRLRPARLLRNLLLSRQPEHADRFYAAAFEQMLLGILERVQPDVVQMESLFLTEYLPAVRRAVPHALCVLRMHNIEHQIWSRAAKDAAGAKRLYLRILARRMARYEAQALSRYDLLLPITTTDANAAEHLAPHTAQQLTAFGVRISQAAQAFSSAAHSPKLYHLGAMDWLPNRVGVEWFIQKAWPAILAQEPRAEFHFGGRLLEKEFGAPLPAQVFNHGAVADATIFAAGMDALVVPLRAGGGIRVKILEAMAAGKLVLSTSIGIQGIAAKPGVHFVRADTPQEFADAVEWMTHHPADAARMAAAGQALVYEHYDARKIVAGLSARVLQLLEERRR